ncbi:hypothetical protein GAYE_SCF53G6174 [Galdieria yellowstonensis]|uniref:Enoyl-[acyl-carrier-protein] reductase (NADH) n=1 Tax=Galdieria yellowstonensis TaxID=3028027 RepID=A0AAV9ILW2_9RHOD|nr:hypothetical protein GAYE_SCF53G6174 [Galdieria yellowstonensis]
MELKDPPTTNKYSTTSCRLPSYDSAFVVNNIGIRGCSHRLFPSSTFRSQSWSSKWTRFRTSHFFRMTSSSPATSPQPVLLDDLRGKKALVTGIANNKSIAYGIAQSLYEAGAELGITYLPVNDRVGDRIKQLTQPLQPSLFLPCDVQKPDDVDNLVSQLQAQWSQLDILVHCLAFANKEDLVGEFSKTTKPGFELALNVSAYSLIELCGKTKHLMKPGSSIVTMTYLGADKVVPNYNVMGVAKAALEASVRYLAAELGPNGIRINAISAGPIRTLASSAIGGIMDMIEHVERNAPLRRSVTQKEVGNTAAFLLSNASSGITGQVIYVDAGYQIMGAAMNHHS